MVLTVSSKTIALLSLCLLTPALSRAEKFYTYVGDIGATHVLLAWGTTTGGNTIGRSSKSHGKATVRVGGQELTVTDRNWAIIRNLQPDTEYTYEVLLKNAKIGTAKIRTWPEKADKVRFFVIGDFGTGDENQAAVARAMWQEYQRLWGDNPVRFVITTGDNIYGTFGITLRFRDTGDEDEEWETKFFRPYEPVIARIPFFPSLGNHDGNETERREDLMQYMDNVFVPGLTQGARYYRFSYGNFMDFYSLDTTTNAEQGSPRPLFNEGSEQNKWLVKNMAESQAPWKVPYFHHPPFNAGPRHPALRSELRHWTDLFKKHGVKVVFNGHEHNLQFTYQNRDTDDIRYVITGAGGELRPGDVKASMRKANIEGWAPYIHFMSVEVEGKEMRITPIGAEKFDVVDHEGKKIDMPLVVKLP